MTDLAKVSVAPDAVRVWRGFRQPDLSVDEFCTKLGSVFVPATVKMQAQAGLQTYVPTILAGLLGKPDTVPDETAILFWESQETYWNGFGTLAVRTYTLTHSGVYTMTMPLSRADFPERFVGTLDVDQPVYLFEKAADWMRGRITHLVGGRPRTKDPATFRADVADALRRIESDVVLEGAIACVGDEYLVYWELGPAALDGAEAPRSLPILQHTVDWAHVFAPASTVLSIELWEEWPGMDIKSGSSFNMQFERRGGTKPE